MRLGDFHGKVAFVVGNGAYDGAARLDNPPGDADAVRTALARLGFTVYGRNDAAFEQMEEDFTAFEAHLERRPCDVALIYFAGHGLQHEEVNYLVPLGAEDRANAQSGRLIALQELIIRITDNSARRLVFLDTCRSNLDEARLTGDMLKARSHAADRAILVDGQPLTLENLEALSNTFLAFAAAPGKVAYDGDGPLSPFTSALLRHIEAVDLPLTHLTIRVRREVLEETQRRQRTWDNSSLTAPFYFNPSSQLLLIGNMIAMSALVVSLLPLGVLLWENAPPNWLALGAAIVLAVFALFLAGMQKAYARLRGGNEPDPGKGPRGGLWRSVRKGMTGGLFGGVLAGVLIGYAYWYDWTQLDAADADNPGLGQIMTEVTVTAIFVAAVLGALSLALVESSSPLTGGKQTGGKETGGRKAGTRKAPDWLIILGFCLFAGMASGQLTAPPVTLYFGRLPWPVLDLGLILPGVIAGTALIAFTVVNYSLDKLSPWRLAWNAGAAAVASVVSLAFGALLLAFFAWYGTLDLITDLLTDRYRAAIAVSTQQGAFVLIHAGVFIGFILGPIVGLLIGLTLLWTKET